MNRRDIPFYVLSFIVAILALFRVFGASKGAAGYVDNVTLLYLIAAAAILVARNIRRAKYSDFEIELEGAIQNAKEAKTIAAIAEDSVNSITRSQSHLLPKEHIGGLSGPPVKGLGSLLSLANSIGRGKQADDPWKGMFGGSNIDKIQGRVLDATVEKFKGVDDWYSVKLIVSSIGNKVPLSGDVVFFVHDTFPNPKTLVRTINGRATLQLKAWGAFTVGVIADEGNTKLELDLSELKSAPEEFRIR